MNLSDAIKLKINTLLEQNNMKVWDLCKMSGVPCSTVSTFMNSPKALPKLDTLLHVCEGFGISLGEFFSDEIFKDTEQD